MNRKAVLPLIAQAVRFHEPPRAAFESYRWPRSTCDFFVKSLEEGSFDYKGRVIREKES